MASFGSVRDAARAWDATSYEGNEAVLDSGWATARPTGAIGSPLRGPRRRVVRGVAHAGFPMASFGSVRDATSYEGNEAVLDSGWATARPTGAIGSPLRGLRRRVVRGVAHAGFPMASFGSVRDAARASPTTDARASLVGLRRRLASVLEKPTSDSAALCRRRPTSRSAQRRRCLSRRGAPPRRSRYADRGGFRWRRQLA